jgi:hypothetical protein
LACSITQDLEAPDLEQTTQATKVVPAVKGIVPAVIHIDSAIDEMIKTSLIVTIKASKTNDKFEMLMGLSEAIGILQSVKSVTSLKNRGLIIIPSAIGDADSFFVKLISQRDEIVLMIQQDIKRAAQQQNISKKRSKPKENIARVNISEIQRAPFI